LVTIVTNSSDPIEFLRNDVVRLLGRHGDVRFGSHGRIVGRFARDDVTYLVEFDRGQGCASDVRPGEIVRAG
jgi:hypothetical protein